MHVGLVGLWHSFPGKPALFRGVTAAWESGAVVAVVGPSGSGKSTLLALLAGWLQPSGGTVVRPEHSSVAWVFQNPHGVAKRSVLDHVVLPILAQGRTREAAEERARDLLARFALQATAMQTFASLSGGEAQRLMLARAVATEADLILVDEPTAQLDHVSASSVIEVLSEIAQGGALVIIATHDERVRARCDQVLDLATFAVDS